MAFLEQLRQFGLIFAREHRDWIAPHKQIFIGPLADSDKWEIRLQIVRALPLFDWTPAQARRVRQILLENVEFPQTFVRAFKKHYQATPAQFAHRRPDDSAPPSPRPSQ